MKTDRQGDSTRGKVAAIWEDRWVRFRLALKLHGVERRHQDFYRGWVLAWIKFIKLRKFDERNLEDVRLFLSHLGTSGRKGWQVHQAEEALRESIEEPCLLIFSIFRVGRQPPPHFVWMLFSVPLPEVLSWETPIQVPCEGARHNTRGGCGTPL